MKISSIILITIFWSLLTAQAVQARSFLYPLQAEQIAKDTWAFIGSTEDFSDQNGGFIVNSAFIVTDAGVVLIDTGPSRRFAEQQREAIAKVTDKPIIRVYLTHHHPDHFLGNQVYADLPLYALAGSIEDMQQEGESLLDNMYRMLGGWMRGTKVQAATQAVEPGILEIGGHRLEFIALQGHSDADLVIFDHSTGVLFTGDLVFHDRAATTPHAQLAAWQQSLKLLQNLPFKVLVPGHGAISHDQQAITQTADYLQWLAQTLAQGVTQGLTMSELMQTQIPERFQPLSQVKLEFQRSVTHLFPHLEQDILQPMQIKP